jgi:hypothetical protein
MLNKGFKISEVKKLFLSRPAGQTSENAGPQHFLTIVGARGAWTQSNRDMGFALYDSWRRAHILRNQVNYLFVIKHFQVFLSILFFILLQMSPEGLKMINIQPTNPPQEEVIAPIKPKLVAKVFVLNVHLKP